MPLRSPYIASCFLGLRDQRPEPSELEILARQLNDIETDKFCNPSPIKNKRKLIKYVQATKA